VNWRQPLLLLLLGALHPVSYRELKLLRALEWKSRDQIQQLHETRLADLLRHAWQETDYYREVLGTGGIVRDGAVNLDRFEEIPILTKDIIRREGPRLRARTLPKGRKAYANRTGGSTGEPIEYWQDSHYWDVNVATKIYHFEVLGKRLGDRELKIWGSDRDLVLETTTWQRRLQNWLYHRRIRTCSQLTAQDIEAIIDEINRFRPRTVWGYIDGLYTVAQYVNRTGRRLHPPAAVFGGGGTLLPPMGDSIGRGFGAPVVNFYGSREMGDVACECPHTAGLHISSNSHRVEILDPGGRSVVEQEGDIVLTSLHNYAMPFIRYRIGDRGRLTRRACACGRGFPLLESVSGRSMEAFVRSDGAIISPIWLITSNARLIESEIIQRIQFVQEDYQRVLVKIVVAERASAADVDTRCGQIRAKLKEVMGAACDVRFERVTDIPPSASGKYLYTVSKVQPQARTLEQFSA
jgi:phenylacetate-CoA ligase